MRLLLLTTTILALLASLVLAADTVVCRSSNRNGENNREIVQAINAFCGWTWDLTVPSVKAKLGAYSKNGRIRVNINGGTCAKTSWVPRKYCISQFYRVCAVSVKAGRGGNGVLGFGPGGCQKFTISNA